MHSVIRLALALLVALQAAQAQIITPVTRFHAEDSQYKPYSDNFLSGFMQTAPDVQTDNGFLQSPFVGDPLLIYVGEKDSTQFMAYASGYRFEERRPDLGRYAVDYIRYHVRADIQAHPVYAEHTYTYPDTAADKGFLLDIDHAGTGEGNEDMDVVFVDKRTVRAYKRSYGAGSSLPELYYVAHFSHPFKGWNVRREIVYTENGGREARCKVAFMFDLKKGESLKVESAVSSVSTDKAFRQIDGLPLYAHVSDKRKPRPKEPTQRLLADNRTTKKQNGTPPPSAGQTDAQNRRSTSSTNTRAESDRQADAPTDFIDISTRDAEVRAAFYAAFSRLKSLPECKGITDAAAFFDAITPYYLSDRNAAITRPLTADSLLRASTRALFSGGKESLSYAHAAWYVFHAIGIVPSQGGNGYLLVRPLFNVADLTMPQGRRMIVHVKGASPRNVYTQTARLMGQSLPEDLQLTRRQLLRGGVLEVRMTDERND